MPGDRPDLDALEDRCNDLCGAEVQDLIAYARRLETGTLELGTDRDRCRTPPYKHLDPGVRELVRTLNEHGFTTTDSGDGVSKNEHGRVLDFLHVFMVTEPEDLLAEADRLEVWLMETKWYHLVVEATYTPRDGTAVIALLDPPDTP